MTNILLCTGQPVTKDCLAPKLSSAEVKALNPDLYLQGWVCLGTRRCHINSFYVHSPYGEGIETRKH